MEEKVGTRAKLQVSISFTLILNKTESTMKKTDRIAYRTQGVDLELLFDKAPGLDDAVYYLSKAVAAKAFQTQFFGSLKSIS